MRPDSASLQVPSAALLSLFSQVRNLSPEAAAKVADRFALEPLPRLSPHLDRPLAHLPLPHGCLAALRRMGLQTVGELAAQSEAALLKRHGLGPGKVKAIKSVLAAYGLSLAG